MAECVILKSGGAYGSSDCTAGKAQVRAGYTAITSDSNEEPVEGTIPDKAAATYYAGTSDQEIAAGQYLAGKQTIKKLTQTNLSGANIKPGVTIKINNGNADVWSVESTMTNKAAATYYANASADQTIAANQYLGGAQTIKKLTQSNLSAGNIKAGTRVKVNNGNADVWDITGTCAVLTRNLYTHAIKGFGADSDVLTSEESYTMPRAGVVYFGMCVFGYGGTPKAKVELIVNGTTKDSVELTGAYSSYAYQYAEWAQQNVAANDVVKIKCTITQGTHVFGMIGAHFSC